MTYRTDDFQPDDQALPEGWEPASDNDPTWQRLGSLLKEADSPEPLNDALREALHLETRKQLLREKLIRREGSPARGGAEPGFMEWCRLVLSGGGAGAQTLRLGAAFGVALLVGMNLSPSDAPPAGGAEQNAATEYATPVTETPAPSPVRQLAELTGPAPQSAPQSPPQPNGFMEKSEPEMGQQVVAWEETAPPGSWIFHDSYRPAQVQVSAAAAASADRAEGFGSRDSDSQLLLGVVDRLQVLKLNSIVSRDEHSLNEIRRIERILGELTEQAEWEPSSKTRALEFFQKGERALSAQRYNEAVRAFEDSRVLSRGPSSLAFLSDFQIGRIAYENLQNYELARESFLRCLQSYPRGMVTGERRAYLEARVQLLSETAADGWESLRAWQAADRADSASAAVSHLLDVLRKSSSPGLLSDAANLVAEYVIRDSGAGELNAREITDVIGAGIERLGDGPQSARMGFALGEIYARRFQDYPRALEVYRAAMDRQPDQVVERALRLRIHQLLDERLTGLTPIEQ